MANADFLKPTARTDPIGEHACQQSLAVGAAGDKSLEPVVLAYVVAIIMQMLPIFLQAGPAHRVDDRQRAVLTRRNRVANGNVVQINRLVHKTPNELFCACGGAFRQFVQYLGVMLAKLRRCADLVAQDAGDGALRKIDFAELRMIHLGQKSARDKLRIVD